MVKVNGRFEKMEVSQRYYVHGTTDVSKAVATLLNPSENEWENLEAARTILNESKRRVHNNRIDKRKKEILAETKIGDLVTPGTKWGVSRTTLCAFYDLVNEGYFKLTKVRSKEKDATVYRSGYSKAQAYSYRVVYERIQ